MSLTHDHSRPEAIKTEAQIECVARAGEIVTRALQRAIDAARPGETTAHLDQIVRETVRDAGAEALFLGYSQGGAPPFPGAACISVNEEVVHGVPGSRTLLAGDLVSIDVGVRLDGWCADAAMSEIVPGDSGDGLPADELDARRALVAATRSALDACLGAVMPGVRWSVLAGALEERAMDAGLGIVVEYIGHGIGRQLHEWPRVPGYRTGFRGDDFVLEPGIVLAVEPILAARPDGKPAMHGRPSHAVSVRSLQDGWTVVTKAGTVTAHEERTIVVTEAGCRNLTPLELARA